MPTRFSRQLMMSALALALSFTGASRATAGEPPLLAGNDQAFVPRDADGRNTLRVLGLVQVQHAHDAIEGASDTDTLLVNRARVGVLGSVYTENLRYLLVADFGRGKVQLVFASVDYTFIPERLSVRVGQFKRPFSRSFLTSASHLMLIDRPLPVGPSAFGDTSDIGLMLHNGDSQPFEYAVGVFSGNVPGATPDGVHPLVAVRVAGNTGGLSAYSESDLEGGAPRVGVAGAAMFDFREDQSSVSGVVDVLFKAYGLSLTSAWHLGTQQPGSGVSVPQLGSIGHYTQVGYVIENRVEPVVRYSFLMPRGESNGQHDLTGGVNLYLHGNALKLQSDVSVRFNFRDGRHVQDVSFKTQVSLAL